MGTEGAEDWHRGREQWDQGNSEDPYRAPGVDGKERTRRRTGIAVSTATSRNWGSSTRKGPRRMVLPVYVKESLTDW